MVFHNDAALHEPRQTDLKMQCLKFWQIPNETRLAPIDIIPGEYISNLIKNPGRHQLFVQYIWSSSVLYNLFFLDLLLCLPNYLKSKNDLLNNLTQPINDWNIFLLNCDTRPQYKFYLGKSNNLPESSNWSSYADRPRLGCENIPDSEIFESTSPHQHLWKISVLSNYSGSSEWF